MAASSSWRVALVLLLTGCNIHFAASSRGEASLESSGALRVGLSAREVQKRCEQAVQRSHSASETIQALQHCVKDLEQYSSKSKAAHSEEKEASHTYASDINLLHSFLQSLQTKLAATYEKNEKQYDGVAQDHQKVISGFLEKLGTTQAHSAMDQVHRQRSSSASPRNAKSRAPRGSSLHQAKQSSSALKLKTKKLQEALRKVAQRKKRQPHRRQMPSFLQLSAQDGEDSPRSGEDRWNQEQDQSFPSGQQPTSLIQLDAESQAPASLLEQEVSKFANLFWKPLTGGDQPALQSFVGVGFTKDDAEAQAAVKGKVLEEGHLQDKTA